MDLDPKKAYVLRVNPLDISVFETSLISLGTLLVLHPPPIVPDMAILPSGVIGLGPSAHITEAIAREEFLKDLYSRPLQDIQDFSMAYIGIDTTDTPGLSLAERRFNCSSCGKRLNTKRRRCLKCGHRVVWIGPRSLRVPLAYLMRNHAAH